MSDMIMEISRESLKSLVARQLGNIFMFDEKAEGEILSGGIDLALKKCGHCFSHSRNKYYSKNGEPFFSPWHSAQNCIFLYYLSRAVFETSPADRTLADRIYYLNRTLNGADLFYEVKLPDIFFTDHPLGSIMGRAEYSDFFSFAQNCTVGSNNYLFPKFGKNVRMMSGAKVLGKCNVGENVIFAANTYVKDTDIPSCSIVFGSYPDIAIKTRDETYFMHFGEKKSDKDSLKNGVR